MSAAATASAGVIRFSRIGVVDFNPISGSTPSPSGSKSPSPCLSKSCAFRANIQVFFDPASNTAFVKVEAPVALRIIRASQTTNQAPAADLDITDSSRLRVLLHIRPEQITSLASSRLQKLPKRLRPVYERLHHQETLSFQLELASPPTLVVPDIGPLLPRTRADVDLLAAFQHVAGASARALTFYVPGTTLTDGQASSICTTIKSMQVDKRHADISTLFRGIGARCVHTDDMAGLVAAGSPTASASPPMYESEAGQMPPSYREGGRVRKRGRWTSPVIDVDGGESGSKEKNMAREGEGEGQALQQLVDMATAKISRLQDLSAELDLKEAQLRGRIAEADERLNQLADAKTEFEYEASEGLDEYIDDRLEEMRAQLHSEMDDRFDEFGVDLVSRHEMGDFVDEQVRAAEADLRQALAGGGVRVLLD